MHRMGCRQQLTKHVSVRIPWRVFLSPTTYCAIIRIQIPGFVQLFCLETGDHHIFYGGGCWKASLSSLANL